MYCLYENYEIKCIDVYNDQLVVGFSDGRIKINFLDEETNKYIPSDEV